MILNGLPWKQTEIILLFLKLHPSTAFWTLVDRAHTQVKRKHRRKQVSKSMSRKGSVSRKNRVCSLNAGNIMARVTPPSVLSCCSSEFCGPFPALRASCHVFSKESPTPKVLCSLISCILTPSSCFSSSIMSYGTWSSHTLPLICKVIPASEFLNDIKQNHD